MRYLNLIRFFVLLIIFGLAFISFSQRYMYIKSWGTYLVESDSMSPVFNKSDLIVIKKSDNYGVGEIITYKYPLNPKQLITHRIVDLKIDGSRYYLTKGDSNKDNDPWDVREDFVLGSLYMKIPYVGYPILFIKKPLGLLVGVFIPVLAIGTWEVIDFLNADFDEVKKYWLRVLTALKIKGKNIEDD